MSIPSCADSIRDAFHGLGYRRPQFQIEPMQGLLLSLRLIGSAARRAVRPCAPLPAFAIEASISPLNTRLPPRRLANPLAAGAGFTRRFMYDTASICYQYGIDIGLGPLWRKLLHSTVAGIRDFSTATAPEANGFAAPRMYR